MIYGTKSCMKINLEVLVNHSFNWGINFSFNNFLYSARFIMSLLHLHSASLQWLHRCHLAQTKHFNFRLAVNFSLLVGQRHWNTHSVRRRLDIHKEITMPASFYDYFLFFGGISSVFKTNEMDFCSYKGICAQAPTIFIFLSAYNNYFIKFRFYAAYCQSRCIRIWIHVRECWK